MFVNAAGNCEVRPSSIVLPLLQRTTKWHSRTLYKGGILYNANAA
jgi:hypothetical protein